MKKIFLRDNWAESFIFGDRTPGVFVGRNEELESLKFTLLNNDSGAILVSAVRGVGKTCFVHKALSDIQEEIHPLFVNSGHVMSSLEDPESAKKELLTSLIRAAYFEFREKDKEIEEIYYKAIGKYKEYKSNSTSTEKTSEKGVNLSYEYNFKSLIAFGGTVLATIGITLNELWAKIVGCLGLLAIPMTFIWKKKWTEKIVGTSGKETIIEDSIDYIESLFETWLKNKQGEKLIFVIDELDKVDEKSAFTLIKEYKNLFSRSFAHFIFIAGPHAWQQTKKSREAAAKEGGIFPTLFTQTYYLPLPNTEDLHAYLDEILKNKEENEELVHLKNYLLFHAKNDFFSLKNIINDFLLFENGQAYLDIEYIKSIDLHFDRATHIYKYAALFCEKKQRRGKKFWEQNSLLQKEVFDFLNLNIANNFTVYPDHLSEDLHDLLLYMQRLMTLKKVGEEIDAKSGEDTYQFNWTEVYKEIEKADQLFEEEQAFLDWFDRLIKIANDLNYIAKGKRYKKVYSGNDGSDISGVNLFSIYKKYQPLQTRIKSPKKRMNVLLEDVATATNEIKDQLSSIDENVFEITTQAIENALKSKSKFYLNETFTQRPSAFGVCTGFSSAFDDYEHKLFGKSDGTKEVMLVENFAEFDQIETGLSMLNGNKDLLVINIITDDDVTLDRHPVIFKDKIGRTRKKGMTVKNFYNYKFKGKISEVQSYVYRVNQYFQYY